MGKIKIKFVRDLADIQGMKKLALTIITAAGITLSGEEYTIQTISTLKESSITSAFEKKVQKSALPVTRKKEGACNVVMLGHYADAKKARADLAKAKAVAKDAFVRPAERNVPKACAAAGQPEKKEAKGAVAEAKPASAAPASAGVAATAEKAKEAVPSETPKAVVTVAPVSAAEPVKGESGKKTETVSAPEPIHTAIVVYDRNIARKSDIHEAIEYYKNSPYHSFRPVAIQK